MLFLELEYIDDVVNHAAVDGFMLLERVALLAVDDRVAEADVHGLIVRRGRHSISVVTGLDTIQNVIVDEDDSTTYGVKGLLKLTYDKDKVPDELANTVALYFYAVDTQNYDLYLEQINPLYRTSLESLLQEQYGYGLENSMEQLHQNLVNYAGTDNFTIQSLELAQAQEVLAEDFEEDTNFVQEYLNAYTQAFGEEFTKDLEEQSDAIYDIAVTMKGENSDGEEITILDSLEILAAEADGSFGVLG